MIIKKYGWQLLTFFSFQDLVPPLRLGTKALSFIVKAINSPATQAVYVIPITTPTAALPTATQPSGLAGQSPFHDRFVRISLAYSDRNSGLHS